MNRVITIRRTMGVLGAAVGMVVLAAAVGLGIRADAGAPARLTAYGPVAGGPGNHGWARLCDHERGASLEALGGVVDGFLAFTPEQREAWNELARAWRAGEATITAACRDLPAGGEPTSAPEHLVRIEALMATGLAVIRDIRPGFERFYAALSDAQQQALDRLVSRHGHR